MNPAQVGTKAAVWREGLVPAGVPSSNCGSGSRGTSTRRRSTTSRPVLGQRRGEADDFYAELQKDLASPDERSVQRQAFAGMIWNKQFYHLDVFRWLKGDPNQPVPPAERASTAATANGRR